MATTHEDPKHRLLALIDELPDEALAEVVSFAEFQRYKLAQMVPPPTPYRPVKVGGLWKGIQISDEDIAEARREMWEGFGERELWVPSSSIPMLSIGI